MPGVSKKFVLRESIVRGANMWSPNKVAYDMLKAAVAGTPRLAFTRYHEASVTKIRSHLGGQKLCKKILGYNANALYLWKMANDMLCERGVLRVCTDVVGYMSRLKAGSVSQRSTLRAHTSIGQGMCPLIANLEISEESDPKEIKEYLTRTNRPHVQGKTLWGPC